MSNYTKLKFCIIEGSEKGVFDLIFALCGYIFLNLGSKDRFAQKKTNTNLGGSFYENACAL